MRYVELIYDIPEKVRGLRPTHHLGRFGARIQQSAWLIPEHLVPWSWVDLVKATPGCRIHVVRYDESEHGKLKALAMESLNVEAWRIREQLDASLHTAKAKLDDATRLQDADAVEKGIKFARACLARAKRHLRVAEEAALAFELTGEFQELLTAARSQVAARSEWFFSGSDPKATGGGLHTPAVAT